MENEIKTAYESPWMEIIELKLHGGIAQLVTTSDPQYSGFGDEEEM